MTPGHRSNGRAHRHMPETYRYTGVHEPRRLMAPRWLVEIAICIWYAILGAASAGLVLIIFFVATYRR